MIALPTLPQYLIESSICLAAFYLFYKIWLQKTTFFQANRIYLLGGAVLSFVLPFLHISLVGQEEVVYGYVLPLIETSNAFVVEFNEGMEKPTGGFSLSLSQMILMVYVSGALFFIWRFFYRLRMMFNMISSKEEDLPVNQDTASFFRWMFIHPRHRNESRSLIVEHEKVHIRQWHSLDIIIMEILTILNWFNPFIHLYNKRLKETHEFIADRYVAGLAGNPYEYAQLLVNEVTFRASSPIYNTFASLIKKRLIMLSNKNSKKRQGVRYLAIIPMIFVLALIFSFDLAEPINFDLLKPNKAGRVEMNNNYLEELMLLDLGQGSDSANGRGKTKEEKDKFLKDIRNIDFDSVPPAGYGDEVYEIVEVMPHFKECGFIADDNDRKKCSEKMMMNQVNEFISYPDAARNNGTEGVAVVQFVVEKDGSTTDFNVVKNPGDGLGEEALRVARMLGPWNPGKQRNEFVRVQFTFPVRFKLDEEGKEEVPKVTETIRTEDDVYEVVEFPPAFPGCENISDKKEKKICSEKALMSYINQNIEYPAMARENDTQGVAVVQFIVEKDGRITGAKVVKNPGHGTGAEVLKLVNGMPKWNPGKLENGEKVRVRFTLPVRFKLADPEPVTEDDQDK